MGVVIQAEHSCMTLRGVNARGSTLTTSRLLGVFRDDPRTREEFLGIRGIQTICSKLHAKLETLAISVLYCSGKACERQGVKSWSLSQLIYSGLTPSTPSGWLGSSPHQTDYSLIGTSRLSVQF